MQVRTIPRLGIALAMVLGLGGVGCGPTRSGTPFEVTPEAPTVQVGERIALEALASEDQTGETEWEVVETYGGGLLQTKGTHVTYVAPPSAGTFHLRLRATAAGNGILKQEIPIRVLPHLKLEPHNPSVPPGGVVVFSVRQKGLPRGTFAWSVEDVDGGSIGPDGTYQAPAAPGTYRITAISTEDKTAAVSTTVTVQ